MNSFDFVIREEDGNLRSIDSTWYFNRIGDDVEVTIALDYNNLCIKTSITPSNPELFSTGTSNFETGEWLPEFVNCATLFNPENIYVVLSDDFGVRDLKFIIPWGGTEYQIYMTTDVVVSEPSRPITFENFEVFNKNIPDLEVSCVVDTEGFKFKTTGIPAKEGDDSFIVDKLNFRNRVSGFDRVRVYQSELYKNGCSNFDDFESSLGLWKTIDGWDHDTSDFKRNKFNTKRHSYYTSSTGSFSLMMAQDFRALYLDIFKSVLERLTSSSGVLKSTKTSMELLLLRWFNENLVACKNMLPKLIELDESINDLINASYKFKKYSIPNRKNDVLY